MKPQLEKQSGYLNWSSSCISSTTYGFQSVRFKTVALLSAVNCTSSMHWSCCSSIFLVRIVEYSGISWIPTLVSSNSFADRPAKIDLAKKYLQEYLLHQTYGLCASSRSSSHCKSFICFVSSSQTIFYSKFTQRSLWPTTAKLKFSGLISLLSLLISDSVRDFYQAILRRD